jgi:hypothetical protein
MTDPGPGPIEAATARLLAWLGRVAGAPARVGLPGPSEPDGSAQPASSAGPDLDGVVLWPLDVRPAVQTRSAGPREPYRFTIRYLVTASLRSLDRVLADAVAHGEPEISLTAGDSALWSALGVPPRPALILDVPAQIAYAEQVAPPVLHPLRIDLIARRTLAGTVVGPGDVPIAAIRVDVLGTTLSTNTDAHGRFSLAGVPDTGEVRLRLVGRGRVFVTAIDPRAVSAEEDLTIHCEMPTR